MISGKTQHPKIYITIGVKANWYKGSVGQYSVLWHVIWGLFIGWNLECNFHWNLKMFCPMHELLYKTNLNSRKNPQQIQYNKPLKKNMYKHKKKHSCRLFSFTISFCPVALHPPLSAQGFYNIQKDRYKQNLPSPFTHLCFSPQLMWRSLLIVRSEI